MSVGPDPKRLRLNKTELSELTKEEILGHWAEIEKYLDHLETKANSDGQKECSELVSLRESEEKLKQQQAEATRRENVLVMRLTTKEQEMQEYASQIQELKRSQVPGAPQLRSSLLDPAVNLMFERMKKGLDSTKAKLEDTQNDLSAWKFTPDSNTGKRLMAKCRLLHQENEELGKMISSGRVAKLEGDLALQRNFSEEMKKSQADLDEFLMELDEDVEGMQSTIYQLQQQLRESKEQVTRLHHENLSLKSPVFENDATDKTPIIVDRGSTPAVTALSSSEDDRGVCDADKAEAQSVTPQRDVAEADRIRLEDDDDDDDTAEPMEEGTTGSVSPRSMSEEEAKSKSTTPLIGVDQETNSSSYLDANRSQSPDEDDKRRTRMPSSPPPSRRSTIVGVEEENVHSEDEFTTKSVVQEESSEEAAAVLTKSEFAKESRTREPMIPEEEYVREQTAKTSEDAKEAVNNGDSLLASPASNVGRAADDGESGLEDLVLDSRSTENGHLNDEENENVAEDADSRTLESERSRTPSPRTPVGTPPPPCRAIDGKTHSDNRDYDDRDVEDAGCSNSPICLNSRKATLNGLSDSTLIATAVIGEESDSDL